MSTPISYLVVKLLGGVSIRSFVIAKGRVINNTDGGAKKEAIEANVQRCKGLAQGTSEGPNRAFTLALSSEAARFFKDGLGTSFVTLILVVLSLVVASASFKGVGRNFRLVINTVQGETSTGALVGVVVLVPLTTGCEGPKGAGRCLAYLRLGIVLGVKAVEVPCNFIGPIREGVARHLGTYAVTL